MLRATECLLLGIRGRGDCQHFHPGSLFLVAAVGEAKEVKHRAEFGQSAMSTFGDDVSGRRQEPVV